MQVQCEAGPQGRGNPPTATTPDRTSRPDYQPWNVFLELHLNTMVACDFFCKSIWTPLGKQSGYVLVFMHLGTRKVWTSSATYQPDEIWIKQQARNFTMRVEDHCLDARFCLHDRDTKFTKGFDGLRASAGIRAIKTPVLAPNVDPNLAGFSSTTTAKPPDQIRIILAVYLLS